MARKGSGRKLQASPYAATKSAHKNSRSLKFQASARQCEEPTVSEPPTAAELLSQSQQTTDEWYKSVRTKKGYANYVKSGKEWLVEWAKKPEAERMMGDDEVDDDSEMRTNLEKAFNSITDHTPVALRMLISYKCDHQGRGFATAEGLRSAFKHYFER